HTTPTQQVAPASSPLVTTASAYAMPPKFAAPSTPRTAAQAVARKEEVEMDMFAQHEVGVATVTIDQPVETVAAPAATESMRGMVYNESFIPPQPVDPGTQDSVYNNGQQFSGLAASRPFAEPAPAAGMNGGLTLRPPVP